MIKSIAVDMDNVLADIESHAIAWYEKEYNVKILKKNIAGIPEEEIFPKKEAFRKFLFTPGIFSTAPIVHGAVNGLLNLATKYKIYIVSAAMEFPLSLLEKKNWLSVNFPFISWKNIIFCGDKSVIQADYLIDDHCKNLDVFKGKAILFTVSHNLNIKHHLRLNNWDEVINHFKNEP